MTTDDRPYFAHGLVDLAKVAAKARESDDAATLHMVLAELLHRSSPPARNLERWVAGTLYQLSSDRPHDVEAEEQTSTSAPPDPDVLRQLEPWSGDGDELPRLLSAEPIEAGLQVDFFESVALPAPLVAQLNMEGVDPGFVRRFAGWRMDFPPPRDVPQDGSIRALLGLAEDLLLRGTTPLAFPSVEGWLEPESEPLWLAMDALALRQVLRQSGEWPLSPHVPGAYDSDEERALLAEVTSANQENGAGWTFQTQVHATSMAPGLPPSARCDLLMTRVDGARVVVELDGLQQESHASADKAFDSDLEAEGFDVLQIPVPELRARSGGAWSRLMELLTPTSSTGTSSSLAGRLRAYRLVHQLQVTIVRALRSGHLPLAGSWDLHVRIGAAPSEEIDLRSLLGLGANLASELLLRLCRIWAVDSVGPTQVNVQVVTPSASEAPGPTVIQFGGEGGTYAISDVVLPAPPLRTPIAASTLSPRPSISPNDGAWFLRWIYRKDSFWEGQWDCIERTVRGQDTLVLLPTGGGKSIAFQLAALLRPGPCIVVDPIVSLMDDQIDNLRTVGLDRTLGVSSRQLAREKEELPGGFASGHYKFCFVAPERFQSIPFRETLRALAVNSPVSLIAIDEAHCVSEWGHDFRAAYLNLSRITREYCTKEGGFAPPLVGLTGTASYVVLKDVQRAMGIFGVDAIITPSSLDRPELHFRVVSCPSAEKAARLRGLLSGMPGRFGLAPGSFFTGGDGAGLVFCPHVNHDFGIKRVAEDLAAVVGRAVATYSGSAPEGVPDADWESHKIQTARAFKRNRLSLLACTKAFGMGIDKPNIRFTVHFGLPTTVEAFYQEAGRAGRDRAPAESVVILSVDHPDRARYLLDPNRDIEALENEIRGVTWADSDDVTRALYFHVNSFVGLERELGDIDNVTALVGTIEPGRRITLSWRDMRLRQDRSRDPQRRVEKAIHHLVSLGVVRDYTIDWARREFEMTLGTSDREGIGDALAAYVGIYQIGRAEELGRKYLEEVPDDEPGRILCGARLLLEFMYETIERARRRALSEMLQAATDALGAPAHSDVLKKRVLDYLTRTHWDERLRKAADKGAVASSELLHIAEQVVSTRDAEELRGATVRQLSSYPDQPGFLLLRAFAEGAVAEPKRSRISEDLAAAVDFGVAKYSVEASELSLVISGLARVLHDLNRDAAGFVAGALQAGSRDLDRLLCRDLPPDLALQTVSPLMHQLLERAEAVTTQARIGVR